MVRRSGGSWRFCRDTSCSFSRRPKDADPDVPILKEAKAEYARLQ